MTMIALGEFRTIFIILAVLAVVGGGIAYSAVVERRRRKAMAEKAAQLGLSYSLTLPIADYGSFTEFPISQVGHSRAANNAIVADTGDVRMVIFDYLYKTGGGKNQKTHRQTIVMFRAPSLGSPAFDIRPEGFFNRVAELFGRKDIDFDDDATFSKMFLLQGADEAAIREYFTSTRRRAFVELGKVCVQARPGCFIFYRSGGYKKSEQLDDLMRDAYNVYGVLMTVDS